MRWFVLRPAGLLEDIAPDFVGKISATSWKIAVTKNTKLQYVSTDDIGYFAAKGFMEPQVWKGGNEISREKTGRKTPLTFGIVTRLVLWTIKDLGIMMKWLDGDEFGVEIEEPRRMRLQG